VYFKEMQGSYSSAFNKHPQNLCEYCYAVTEFFSSNHYYIMHLQKLKVSWKDYNFWLHSVYL